MKEYLGREMVDVATGFTGTVTSVSEDLDGNVGLLLSRMSSDGKIESSWFNRGRLDRSKWETEARKRYEQLGGIA